MNQLNQNSKQETARRLQEYLSVSGLRPGDKLPSEREMAAFLGLGRAALRPLLSQLETQGILERRPQSGTFLCILPPPMSSAAQVPRIALIAPFRETDDPGRNTADPFWFHRVVSAFEQTVSAVGGKLTFFDQSPHIHDAHSVKTLARAAIQSGADAVVLLHPSGQRETIACALGLLHNAGVHPLILSARTYPGLASQVYFDSGWGVHMAVAYLINRGHKKIGFAGASDGHEWVRERLAGFQNALAAAEIPGDPAWVWLPSHGSECPATRDDGSHAFTYFQSLPPEKRPTALVTANDVIALGVLQAARNASLRVPNDFSLIGFDNDPEAMLAGLTTIARPSDALGEAAAHLVLERFAAQHYKDTVSVRLRPVLIERHTVAEPPPEI